VTRGPAGRTSTPSQPKVELPPPVVAKPTSQPKIPAKPTSQPKVELPPPVAAKPTSQPKLPGVPAAAQLPSSARLPPVQPVHGRTSQTRASSPVVTREPNAPAAPTPRSKAVSGSIARDTPLPPPFVPPGETLPGPKLPQSMMPLTAPAPNPSFVPVALRAPLFEAPVELPTLTGSSAPPPPSPSTSRLSQRMLAIEPPRSSRTLLTVTTLVLALAVAGALTVSFRGPQRIEPDVTAPLPATGVGGVAAAPPPAPAAKVQAPKPSPAPVAAPAAVPVPAKVEAAAPKASSTGDAELAAAIADLQREADAIANEPVRKPARHRSPSRPRPAARESAPDPDRTVKEGRIVDPFASFK
jgi:hypothetical protein